MAVSTKDLSPKQGEKKVLIIRDTMINGKIARSGDLVSIPSHDANYLISAKKASVNASKKR